MKMKDSLKYNYLKYITIVFLCVHLNLHAQTSYIQVISEAGISVYLDETFKGKSTLEMGGLIIKNVSPGRHTIKVIKDGFNPQTEDISVKPGEVFSYTVKPFVPHINISQQGNTGDQQIDLQVGIIKIQSLPLAIQISIPSLGINSSKVKDEWVANDIPVGAYFSTYSWNNKIIHDTINVRLNFQTHHFVNMLEGIIEDRSTKFEQYATQKTTSYSEQNDSIVKNKEIYVISLLGGEFELASSELLTKIGIQNGVVVKTISKDSKLSETGMRVGFVITHINKKPIFSCLDLQEVLLDKKGALMIEGVYPNRVRAYYGFGL